MSNKIIYRVLVISSLFFFTVINPAYSAGEIEQSTSTMQQVTEKIDINKASMDQLAKISGIGEKKAQAIIDYREAYGDFVNLTELVKVKGIGESTLKKIEPFVTL
ncbi:MAG: helix-hairpin-helix domain-containing protein [Psychromonas sp.]